jgi:hypothetical protein
MASRRVQKRASRKQRRKNRNKRTKRKQRGGQVPTGYAGMPVSYTPREPGELGSPDMVPRVGSVEDAAADAEAAQQP